MSYEMLKVEVIDAGLCQGCAKCAGTCKHIEMVDLKPRLKDKCILEERGIDCGACYRTCPQVIQEPFASIEREPVNVFSLRARDMIPGSKAGGVVTALAKMLLGSGAVDRLVMVRDDDGKPVADIITDPARVSAYAGVTLGRSGILEKLAKAISMGKGRVGIVGLPCEIRGATEMERRMNVNVLKIALFCNSQMRSDRTDLGDTASPCSTNCPAGVNARDYIALIKEGRFQEAIDLIREDNPLPSICGRICTHECEHGCTLMGATTPVAVRELKKFVSEWEMTHAPRGKASMPLPGADGPMVAVIGGGPAGLTCAYYLAKLGYRPTIFEKSSQLGGMLRAGVPAFRLPDAILNYDVETIKALGVDVKLGTPVGPGRTIDDLKAMGYRAFFLATGQWQPRTLNTPGEDLPGVHVAVSFLQDRKYRYWENKEEFKDKTLYVLGGGPVAVDVAQTALRLGARKVYLAEIRTAGELKVVVDDIPPQELELMKYLYSTSTVRFERGENDKLRIVAHEVGPAPPYREVEGSEFTLEVDAVVIAVGQSVDWSDIDDATGSRVEKARDKAVIDELTFETSMPGVFAGGDIVQRGKAVAVAAVAHGREAAVSIDRYLRGIDLRAGRLKKERSFFDQPLKPPKRYAVKPGTIVDQSVDTGFTWDEIDGRFTAEMALSEARRCLACNTFCSHCQDFAGVLGDLGTGEVGSDPGHTTVVAWTATGLTIVKDALERGLLVEGTVNRDAVAAAIQRKAGRELWTFEQPLRQRVLGHVTASGPATIEALSRATGAPASAVRYEALRLVQERKLSMDAEGNDGNPVFDTYCDP